MSRFSYSQPLDPSIPLVPASRLLSIPSTRPGRRFRQNPIDPHLSVSYGDPIIQKFLVPFVYFSKMSKVLPTRLHLRITNITFNVSKASTLTYSASQKRIRVGHTIM